MPFTEEQINAVCEKHGWKRTGVFATDEEISQSREWKRELDDTPAVRVHGEWLPEAAERVFQERIDKLAMAHGLPQLPPRDGEPDHYGLIVTGEFTTLDAERQPSCSCMAPRQE